jgi:hypothetical protein
MIDLCKYKNALGVPGKGIHSYRLGGIAIADVIMTIIGAFIISLISGWKFIYTLLGLFILGIIIHKLFCVNTTIDKMLFGKSNN